MFNINNEKGEVLLAGIYPQIPGATGDVNVAYVTLRAKGRPGDSSKLDISVIELVDSLGEGIMAKDIDGTVVVK